MQHNRQDMNGAAASSHLPTSLPSLNNAQHGQHHPSQQSNYYVSRHYLRNLPFMAQSNGFVIATNNNNANNNHYAHRRGQPMAASMGGGLAVSQQQQQYQQLPPLSNRNQNAASVAAASMMTSGPATNAAVSQSEAWSKPRLITIVRATDRPRKKITILLNRKVNKFTNFN